MKALSGIVLSAMLGLVASAHAQGTPEEKLDIAGVRVGMTEAQARAALAAFDPELKVTSVMGVYNYSDGVNHVLKTPEFLDRLEGRSKGSYDVSIKVLFSGLGSDVRVIAMSRHVFTPNPPTRAQFVQSLADRYGPPAGFNDALPFVPVWEATGKPSCIRMRDHKGQVVINYGPGNAGGTLMNASHVENLLRQHGNQAKGLLPPDLAQCGVFLSYYLSGEPVRGFTAYLFDLGAMVANGRSRAAWVEQLQGEAVRKRQGQGQTPRL